MQFLRKVLISQTFQAHIIIYIRIMTLKMDDFQIPEYK